MTLQITNKQIRREISKRYPSHNIFDNEEYGEAMIASAEFLKIAEELEGSGVRVRQIRQRKSSDPQHWGSLPFGEFYLQTDKKLSLDTLKNLKSLKNYTLSLPYGQDEGYYDPRGFWFFGYKGADYATSSAAFHIYQCNPPAEGFTKLLENLAGLLDDFPFSLFTIRQDDSVRIR